MRFIDRVKGLFGIETEEQKRAREEQARNEQWERSSLITDVSNLAGKLARINSFDREAMKYSRMSSYQFGDMSIDDLRQIKESLSGKIKSEEAKREGYMRKSRELEEAKWSGIKPQGMTDHDFDRWQRDD